LGENTLRLTAQVERVSHELQTREASEVKCFETLLLLLPCCASVVEFS